MLRFRRLFIVFMLGMSLFLTGCANVSKLRDLRLLDYKIESVDLDGREVEAVIRVKVDNPSRQLYLSDIHGNISLKEDEIAVYRALPFVIEGRGVGDYPIVFRFSVSENLSLIRFLSMLKSVRMADLHTDLQAKVKMKGGVKAKVKLKDFPLKKMADQPFHNLIKARSEI